MYSLAAIVLACCVPVTAVALGLATNAVYLDRNENDLALELAVGTLAYLPMYLPLVRAAGRGGRHPHSVALVAGVALVYGAGLPLLGQPWVHTMLALATAVLLGLPSPWSWSVFAVLVLAVTPALATTLGLAPLWPMLMASKALAIGIMVRLVGSLRRLAEARAELVTAAVGQERLRVEAQLARAVGADLADIVRRARRLSGGLSGGLSPAPSAARDIDQLTSVSRHSLATARHIVHGYRGASVRNELEMAAGLLRAAGVDVELVEAGIDALPADLGPEARDRLHDDLARVLHDPGARRCTLGAEIREGRIRVNLGVVAAEPHERR